MIKFLIILKIKKSQVISNEKKTINKRQKRKIKKYLKWNKYKKFN